MKVIIYPTPAGGVAVVYPAPDSGLTAEQVAQKDVPTGTQYRIIDADELPADRTFRDAWEYQ